MRLELESNPSSVSFAENGVMGDADQNAASEAIQMLHEGIKSAQAGNRAQARVSLLRCAEIDPRNESAWLWLASISEYPEELLVFLNNVLEINPGNERALEWSAATKSLLAKTFVQRGIDAFEANQPDSAAKYFNEALEYDQQNGMAWLWMASLSDSNEGKITYLEKVLSIDPDNQDAQLAFRSARHQANLQLLAEAKGKAVAGKRDEANELLDAIIEESPDSEDAWILKSHLAESFAQKIAAFEKVLQINPENPAAKSGLASLESIMNDVSPDVAQPFAEAAADTVTATFEAADEMTVETEAAVESETAEPFTPEAAGEAETVLFNYKEEVHYDPVEETENVEQALDAADETAEEVQNAVEEPAAESETPDAEAEFASSDAPENVEASEESMYQEAVLATEHETLESSEVGEQEHSPEESAFYERVTESPAFHEEETVMELDSESHAQYDEPESVENNFAGDYHTPEADEEVDELRNTFFVSPAVAETQSPFNSFAADQDANEAHLPEDGIPMPDLMLERSEDAPAPLTGYETRIDPPQNGTNSEMGLSACPFCNFGNEAQSFVCQACMAMLTLSDLERLLGNQHADKYVLRQAVERMERDRSTREFGETELTMLGIGHLNLRNLQYGYAYLYEASQLNPNNVVLSSQVNALLIRLEEIKKQDEAQESKPKGKTILIVDDSPTVRKLIAGKLEKCGHDVFCSSDGVEAMERLQDLVPDLVLLDITMPRMDGYQVCKLIRSNDATKDVPVVMISGNDGFFDKVRGRMAGTSGYITKPFGPETLMKAVETYLINEA